MHMLLFHIPYIKTTYTTNPSLDYELLEEKWHEFNPFNKRIEASEVAEKEMAFFFPFLLTSALKHF